MSEEYPAIHHTEINRIQNGDEGGWEFVCHNCGYRARYTIDKHGSQKLEILFLGNSSARHTSGPLDRVPPGDPQVVERPEPPDDVGLRSGDLGVDETWLPEDLRDQVEAILRKFET